MLFRSIHAMDREGEIVIRGERRSGQIEIEVRDTGEGMDEVTRARIFEPYFSTRPDGMGLGLAIVRATVEEHGGTIDVASVIGEGTVFTIRLPEIR